MTAGGDGRAFAKSALLMFLAMRVGDVVSLAAGMWFVPRYVSPEDIGAVLPVTSFATFLSLPVFALAMAVMKESAALAAKGERGRVKSLLCGVFVCAAAALVVVLAASALAVPRFLLTLSLGPIMVSLVSKVHQSNPSPAYDMLTYIA